MGGLGGKGRQETSPAPPAPLSETIAPKTSLLAERPRRIRPPKPAFERIMTPITGLNGPRSQSNGPPREPRPRARPCFAPPPRCLQLPPPPPRPKTRSQPRGPGVSGLKNPPRRGLLTPDTAPSNPRSERYAPPRAPAPSPAPPGQPGPRPLPQAAAPVKRRVSLRPRAILDQQRAAAPANDQVKRPRWPASPERRPRAPAPARPGPGLARPRARARAQSQPRRKKKRTAARPRDISAQQRSAAPAI